MAANSLPDNVVNNRDILGSAKLQSPVNVFVNTEEPVFTGTHESWAALAGAVGLAVGATGTNVNVINPDGIGDKGGIWFHYTHDDPRGTEVELKSHSVAVAGEAIDTKAKKKQQKVTWRAFKTFKQTIESQHRAIWAEIRETEAMITAMRRELQLLLQLLNAQLAGAHVFNV